ncbi:hypothetical protein M3C31_00025 [Staphylococcus hominis]|uniref:hypothetical protein n=1 Tax=Staphylococcus hominis TaxID=1290 RepID=UPI0021A51E7A|nr:hypothetical protein [Staphylococcus hominis]MCT1482233.1 hypothetical protein [Staphylococcus hominis]
MTNKHLAKKIIKRMESAVKYNQEETNVLFSTLKNDWEKELEAMKNFMETIGLEYEESKIRGAAMIALKVKTSAYEVLKAETF